MASLFLHRSLDRCKIYLLRARYLSYVKWPVIEWENSSMTNSDPNLWTKEKEKSGDCFSFQGVDNVNAITISQAGLPAIEFGTFPRTYFHAFIMQCQCFFSVSIGICHWEGTVSQPHLAAAWMPSGRHWTEKKNFEQETFSASSKYCTNR